jgi:hypothetical protein
VKDVLVTRDDVLERLRADGVPVDDRAAPDRVVFPIVQDDLRTTAVIHWPDDVALTGLILPLPFHVPDEATGVLCEACVRLNHVLLLPGFGVDVDGGYAYFRSVQAREHDGGMRVEALKRMVEAAVSTAAGFAPLLAAVVAGDLTPEQVQASLG